MTTSSNENWGFAGLNISPSILKQLQKLGFTKATPIQQQAIPIAIAGQDLMGIAQTGTGKTASDEQAQEAHSFIRGVVQGLSSPEIALACRILYGGSVKPDNVDGLMSQDDIDGALVGGASLKLEDFVRIARFKR